MVSCPKKKNQIKIFKLRHDLNAIICDYPQKHNISHYFCITHKFAIQKAPHIYWMSVSQFSRSVVSDSVTPWIAARQASRSITNSRSLLKLMSIESVMPSSISSSVVPFSSCPQPLPASGSFPMSQLLGRNPLSQCLPLEKGQRRQRQPTPVLLPGKSHGQRSLVGCSPWGCEELDTTERLHFRFSLSCIREGNGNPL